MDLFASTTSAVSLVLDDLLADAIFMACTTACGRGVHFRLAPFLWIRNLPLPTCWCTGPRNSAHQPSGGLRQPLLPGAYLNLLPMSRPLMIFAAEDDAAGRDEQQAMQQKMMKS